MSRNPQSPKSALRVAHQRPAYRRTQSGAIAAKRIENRKGASGWFRQSTVVAAITSTSHGVQNKAPIRKPVFAKPAEAMGARCGCETLGMHFSAELMHHG